LIDLSGSGIFRITTPREEFNYNSWDLKDNTIAYKNQ